MKFSDRYTPYRAVLLFISIVAAATPVLASISPTTIFSANPPAFAQIAPYSGGSEDGTDDEGSAITSSNYDGNNGTNTITVAGSASKRVSPDEVVLVFAVQTIDETTKDALEENSKVMSHVIDALTDAGVEKNETSTTNFNISPNYNYTQSGNTQELTGYTVTNSIQIKSKNISNVSDWIDTAVKAGANRIDSIYFTLSEDMLRQIRMNLIPGAVDDAKEKAETMASALDTSILGVKQAYLSESGVNMPFIPQPLRLESAAAAETPIIPGEQVVSTSVFVTYNIK